LEQPAPSLGFALPLQLDAQRGIAHAEGADKIRLAILTILGTLPGERLMRPDFGCPLRSLVFAPNNAATASLARFYVESALTRWETRITLDEVRVVNQHEPESGVDDLGPALRIEVRYSVRATGQPGAVTFQLPLA
jgi:phage baseplate assembly protein W